MIVFLFVVVAVICFGGYLMFTKGSQKNVVIAFAGDTMLGRLVNDAIIQKGYSYPWGNVLPVFEKADLRIVNLETTLTKSEYVVPKVFNYKALPDNVHALNAANINVVNLANNHIRDFGDEGLLETIKVLDKAGIKHVGAGATISQAKKPVIIEKNGLKIGIIGYTDNEPGWLAQNNEPGINYIQVGDIGTVERDIKALRSEVDVLILSIHWGPNMRQRPTQEFRDFAHNLIDSGVDIIHGHSAHVFQGIELYKNKLIMYDTGDFVDDYYVTPELRNDQSFLFFVSAGLGGITKIYLVPTLIANMQVNLAQEAEATQTLKRMQQLSAEFGTQIKADGVVVL